MENGRPNPDVWAIGDAATVEDARLPATAQGEFFILRNDCLLYEV